MRFHVRFPALMCVCCVAFSLGAVAVRAEGPFVHSLAPQDWTAVGFARLSTAQMSVLDALIQRDIDSARQGDVVAFAKTFTQRRSEDEWKKSGLDQLTEAERAKLDALIAAAIATRPVMPVVGNFHGTPAPDHLPTRAALPEVHGQVSAFVGAGSGGSSWYGGSFDTWVTDPNHRVSVGVGVSEVRGKGIPWGPCGW